MDMKLALTPTDDCETVFRTGEAKRIYEYKGYRYKAHSTQSFCDLVGSKGQGLESECVIFCNDAGFTAIVDDTIDDRPQDRVLFDFQKSTIAQEWWEILSQGKVFGIKALSEFLLRREPGEVADLDSMLYAVKNFKYVTNVKGDFSFEDRNNYTFNIKTEETEGTVKVPKKLLVTLELFVESGFKQALEVEVEVQRPKDPSETPCFGLSCPKFARYLEVAKDHEVEQLKNLLAGTGFLIVSGSPE